MNQNKRIICKHNINHSDNNSVSSNSSDSNVNSSSTNSTLTKPNTTKRHIEPESEIGRKCQEGDKSDWSARRLNPLTAEGEVSEKQSGVDKNSSFRAAVGGPV